MKRLYQKNKKLFVLLSLVLLSLVLIFFVWRTKDPETGANKLTLTPNGLSSFRLGMDVAWGTRLSYRIDYSKYKEQFKDNFGFTQAKKTAEQIILTQIDNRISKLGVSDYNSYPTTLNNQEYVVVELWWVKDVDEAKSIIGKTVELEFKLQRQEEAWDEEKLARKQLTQSMLQEVVKDPSQFEFVATNKQSDDIYYTVNNKVSLENMPTIYKDNLAIINSIATGAVYPQLLEWLYQDFSLAYENQWLKDLNGYVIVRLVDRSSNVIDQVSATKFEAIASANKKEYTQQYEANNLGTSGEAVYVGSDKEFLYNNGPVFSGQKAYDAVVYQYNAASVPNIDEQITDLQNGKEPPVVSWGLIKVYEGWLEESALLWVVPSFTEPEENVSWKNYPTEAISYVVGTKNKKSADQTMYDIRRMKWVNASEVTTIEQQLKTDRTYSYEEIFVKDISSRVPAKDPTGGDLLNGAYFELARIGQTQLWEPAVIVQFNDEGKRVFCNITEQNIGRQMAIFVGGALKTNPVIQDKICGWETLISWTFDLESAKKLVKDLNEGALPAPLILTQEERISPTLGTQALKGMMWAWLLGLILIYVYMILFYGKRYSLVSLFVLLTFIIYLGGLLKLMWYVISLSWLAAIILTVGMSVDATILVLERLREEKQKKWMGEKDAIIEACNRSRAPIRDGNLSTWLIALLLFMMGVNVFKGFGSMMIISILLILFGLVPLTRELLLFLRHKR